MTIVVALKVGDGLVLGADSASTLTAGDGYLNSYFNAEKLIHVARSIPVGALTFGLGGLANRSISSLANDLRLLMLDGADDWRIDPGNFSVEQVVDRFKRFYFDEHYVKEFGGRQDAPAMGFIIGGYSTSSNSAEIWRLVLTGGGCEKSQWVQPDAPWDCVWDGQPEAIQRILFGYSAKIEQRMVDAGLTQEEAQQLLASMEPMINGAMPIQDAIDLVHYLIEVTCGYVRFTPGHATVAKPIDLAAITKHNGFKWVARKHYYKAGLN